MSDKKAKLEQIKADILMANVCPDLAKQATQIVIGSGNPHADIIFIGEAPGKEEDIYGLPFVGKSGKFLDEMLSAALMNRDDVYITNIVKYRPPNNRDPSSAEKDAFAPYLLRQLQAIGPKVVITLGNHSMQYFFPGKKISQIHGQPEMVTIGQQSFLVAPLYHPAYALYGGKQRQVLIDDFLQVKMIIDQL